jgi:hypothetical protein
VRFTARRLFLASIVYLPVLLALMVSDMDDRLSRLPSRIAGAVGIERAQVADARPTIGELPVADHASPAP